MMMMMMTMSRSITKISTRQSSAMRVEMVAGTIMDQLFHPPPPPPEALLLLLCSTLCCQWRPNGCYWDALCQRQPQTRTWPKQSWSHLIALQQPQIILFRGGRWSHWLRDVLYFCNTYGWYMSRLSIRRWLSFTILVAVDGTNSRRERWISYTMQRYATS